MRVKLWLLGMLLLSVLLGLLRSDRALPGGAEVTPINFWNGFTGPDGRVMLELVRTFNSRNPDVHVSMQRIAWGTYYNKLMVAGVDGRAPEVFILHSAQIPRMERAGFLDVVTDVYGPDLELKEEFDPNLLELLRP
jgi:multiple sugar transport system substrate-binding protein